MQLQSQPNLKEHYEAPQGGEVLFYHSQQCTPHLTPQLVKHQALTGPTSHLRVEHGPMKPGQYHIASKMQYPAQLETAPNAPPAGQLHAGQADPRTGASAGGLKKRNRRLLPAGEVATGEAKSGSCSAAPSEKPELLMPSHQYQDHPESLKIVPNNAAAERRPKRR